MKGSILIWLISLIIVEGLRFVIPFDRLANEIQVVSAIPWIPIAYHQRQLHKRHERIEKHLKEGSKNG